MILFSMNSVLGSARGKLSQLPFRFRRSEHSLGSHHKQASSSNHGFGGMAAHSRGWRERCSRDGNYTVLSVPLGHHDPHHLPTEGITVLKQPISCLPAPLTCGVKLRTFCALPFRKLGTLKLRIRFIIYFVA